VSDRDVLPVDPFVPHIVALVNRCRAAVVTAAPGAGKTTRVPPALAADGRVLLLQPRRVAARAIAHRIASERGWIVGREVGWHVRFDRRESADTRLLVATEGILTARLQQDPLLSGFRTVVVDEFHERSIHADVGLALARQAWLAREDLRLVVMSATIDAAAVARYLGDCPVVDVPGRLFPIDVTYRPGVAMEEAVASELPTADGAILGFLPGAAEIRRAAERLRARVDAGVVVHELHGGLDGDAQDAALAVTGRPRVILATNIAETTLTVPDVRVVVDAGLQKVARYDADRGLDSLETERIPLDAADQRAGRAGRVAAGRAVRLWDRRDRLRPHREPDIARIDLAGPAMDVMAWGGNPHTLEWFEAPPSDALDRALALLESLGAIDGTRGLTPLGKDLRRLPLHPRLGRLLLGAYGATVAARACALLSERHYLVPSRGATRCDLLAAVDQERALPPHVLRVAREIRAIATGVLGDRARPDVAEDAFREAVFAAYPDRVGRRRAPASDRVLLASGTGARLGRESGVVDPEFIVAVDVSATSGGRGGAPPAEAIIRMATGLDREWVPVTDVVVEHRLDDGVVRAVRVERHGAILLKEVPVSADPVERARVLLQAVQQRGPTGAERQLLYRLRAAGHAAAFDDLAREACQVATRLDDVELAAALTPAVRRLLDRDAPAEILLPSGRHVRLSYQEDGRVMAAVKLQELFGLAETPRIGSRRMPVTFELLAPNGRPVQVTSDLRSFWTQGYQEVRRELRARYPRHPWPEDPWTARPTHRTVKRGGR
jgi:ATP-dependent RNA helicase HrpB